MLKSLLFNKDCQKLAILETMLTNMDFTMHFLSDAGPCSYDCSSHVKRVIGMLGKR